MFEDDDYMVHMATRKCTACGELKTHHHYWWDFVSWECEDCEGAEKTSA